MKYSFNELIGIRIKDNRQKINITMKELGERVGLSEATIQRYESGKIKSVDINILHRFAEALDVNFTTLIRLDDSMKEKLLKTNQKINLGKDNNLDPQQEFTSANEAMKWLLQQNVIMAYGGVDLEQLSDEEKIDYTNEVLNQLRLVSYKYKKE